MKRKLILSALLAVAPLTWGEDVWYCTPELMTGIEKNSETGRMEIHRYNDQKFTMKLESEENRLAIVGYAWSGEDEPYYIPCVTCKVFETAVILRAQDAHVNLKLLDSRFVIGFTTFERSSSRTGTCTKF